MKSIFIILICFICLKSYNQCEAPKLRDTYHLSMFQAAQANLDNGANTVYDILFLGNSITEGVYLGTLQQVIDSCYVGRLRTHYNNKYSDVGYGLLIFPFAFENVQTTFTGNWYAQTSDAFGYGYSETYQYTLRDTTASITTHFKGTSVDLIGNFNLKCRVSLDGGSYYNIIPSSYSRPLYSINLASGLSNTDHTITIKHSDSTTMMGVSGFYIKNSGTRGFRFDNAAIAGTTLTKDIPERTMAGYRYLNPILTFVCSITNEYYINQDTNTYAANLRTITDNALLTGDCIFLCNLLRQDVSKASMDPYVRTMKRVAVEKNIPVIDIYTKWNQHGIELGFMHDAIHPNARGDNDIYKEIMKLLEP